MKKFFISVLASFMIGTTLTSCGAKDNNGTKVVQDLFDGKRVFENPKPIELINYLINLFVKQ